MSASNYISSIKDTSRSSKLISCSISCCRIRNSTGHCGQSRKMNVRDWTGCLSSNCSRQKADRYISGTGGRFDFTSIENRENQFKENIWICLILRHRTEYMILGFLRARQLNKKRYLYLAQLRRHKLLTINEWLSVVNR